MSEEVFNSRSRKKHMSSSEIRALQKKALKSYSQITNIKNKSDQELKKSIDIAEKELEKFIDRSNQKTDM